MIVHAYEPVVKEIETVVMTLTEKIEFLYFKDFDFVRRYFF